MHIAYITPEYPHPKTNNGGGMGTSIKNLVEALVKKSHKVTVFVYGMDRNEVFIDHNIHFHLIAQKNYSIGGFYLYRKHIERYINSNVQNIDILEAPDWTGITAFMKLSKPLIIRFHGSDTYFCHIEKRKQKKKNFYLEKLNLQNGTGLLSASSYTAQITKKVFNMDRDFTTIHNAIDAQSFLPQGQELENQILYFGTVIRKKGVLDLAAAFNILIEKRPETHLIFLGKDTADYKTQSSTVELVKSILTEEARNQTTFIEEVPYHEVKEYLSKATVICLPSYAEAYPMTWLEAMSMEKALVTSDIGWAQEMMVHGETGFMVHPSKHKDMAAYLKELLDDQTLRTRMGKNARKRVKEHFSTEVIVKQNISYYKELLGL